MKLLTGDCATSQVEGAEPQTNKNNTMIGPIGKSLNQLHGLSAKHYNAACTRVNAKRGLQPRRGSEQGGLAIWLDRVPID